MERAELLLSRRERLTIFVFEHIANYDSSEQIAESLMQIVDELEAIQSKPGGRAALKALGWFTPMLLHTI